MKRRTTKLEKKRIKRNKFIIMTYLFGCFPVTYRNRFRHLMRLFGLVGIGCSFVEQHRWLWNFFGWCGRANWLLRLSLCGWQGIGDDIRTFRSLLMAHTITLVGIRIIAAAVIIVIMRRWQMARSDHPIEALEESAEWVTLPLGLVFRWHRWRFWLVLLLWRMAAWSHANFVFDDIGDLCRAGHVVLFAQTHSSADHELRWRWLGLVTARRRCLYDRLLFGKVVWPLLCANALRSRHCLAMVAVLCIRMRRWNARFFAGIFDGFAIRGLRTIDEVWQGWWAIVFVFSFFEMGLQI